MLKSGDIVKIITDHYVWVADHHGDFEMGPSIKHKDMIGIFLRSHDKIFDIVLFGDEKVLCRAEYIATI